MSATAKLIRRASATDLPQVYEFELAYIREIEPQQEERWKAAIAGLLRQWTTNLGRMWFAEEDGKTVGYCFWSPVRGGEIRDPIILREVGSAVLASIYVLPSARRLGWGRRLVQQFELDAVGQGFRQLTLGVHENNPARWLYEQCGYECMKLEDNYRYYRKAMTTP